MSELLKNALGHLVPIELVEPIDLARNDLVLELVAAAVALQAQIKEFKTRAMGDIDAFVSMSAEQYGAHLGGNKGNVTLTSYDGKYKVQRAIAEHVTFDERLQAAKALIDGCIKRWSAGADAKIRVLVDHAFQTDKTGRINTARVLALKQLAIDDAEWSQAMQAITDSLQITGSKSYVRIYRRVGDSDSWSAIALDVAGI